MKITSIEFLDSFSTDIGFLAFHSVTFNYRFKRFYIILNKKILHTYTYYKSACDKFNNLVRQYV